ncbi:hypothetical protein LG293_17630 (plasmid) [Citricoccus nitrophenolicus]
MDRETMVAAKMDLFPLEEARVSGLNRRPVVETMVEHDISTPLTAEDVWSYRNGDAPTPEWLRGLFLDVQRRKWEAAQRRQKNEFLMWEAFRTGRGEVPEPLKSRAYDMVTRIAKDLPHRTRDVRPTEAMEDWELGALRVWGSDPEDHRTWFRHLPFCDMEGPGTCGDRARARAEEKRAGQHAKRELLAGGQYKVGDRVVAWGFRVGTVLQINQVTVKVKLTDRRDWEQVRNIDPTHLEHLNPARN